MSEEEKETSAIKDSTNEEETETTNNDSTVIDNVDEKETTDELADENDEIIDETTDNESLETGTTETTTNADAEVNSDELAIDDTDAKDDENDKDNTDTAIDKNTDKDDYNVSKSETDDASKTENTSKEDKADENTATANDNVSNKETRKEKKAKKKQAKDNRKKRAKEKAKRAAQSDLDDLDRKVRTANIKKPFLARVYDKVLPGEYTYKQDVMHMTILFFALVIIVACVFSVFWFSNEAEKKSIESSLTIPASGFLTSQQSTVVETLTNYGFKNISQDSDGNILAYGTSEMVQAYKQSYKDRSVAQADKLIEEGDYGSNGIVEIEYSADARTLTITTTTEVTANSETFSNSIDNEEMNTIISIYSTWCGMRNNGELMTTKFVYGLTASDMVEGEVYYTTTASSGSKMVAELEAAEAEAENANNSNSETTSTDSTNTASNESANSE